MKAIKLFSLIAFVSIVSVFTSCVEDKDFEVPTPSAVEPNLSGLQQTTFKAVKEAYEQAVASGDASVTFENDEYITGYVVSSDLAGNFFEELIIQNKVDDANPTEDPRLGFRISINVTSLYQSYDFGRKVYVKLKGLSVGLANGVLVIGKGTAVDQIQEYEYKDFILRSTEIATITPKVTKISEVAEADENTFVQFENVQFHRDQLALTYAGEDSDQFNGFRTIESCDDGLTIPLESSTFADFKSIRVNQNKGNIQGVFSRDFRDDFNVLLINTLSDVMFDSTDRCDPIELDCGLATAEGTTILFEADFETQTPSSPVSGNGWTNFIEAGSEGWEAYVQSGANASQGVSARMGSFRSGDPSNVAWLITPEIDLDANAGVTMSFETSNSFADGSNLELVFSNDWDGTTAGIATATWGIVPAAYITQDTDSFSSWFTSGIVDLSCGNGTVHFAFKYTGSEDRANDGTYELDNVKISAN